MEDEDGSAEQQVVEDDSSEQQADETELDGRSFRLQIDPKNGQPSFFAAVDLRRSDDASNGSVEYKAGAEEGVSGLKSQSPASSRNANKKWHFFRPTFFNQF